MEFDILGHFNIDQKNDCFLKSVQDDSKIHVDIKFANKLDNLIDEKRSKVKETLDKTEDSLVFEEDNVRSITIPNTKKSEEEKLEEDEKYNFKDVVSKYDEYDSFLSMKRISKPILKALTASNIYKPKPIQSACIPYALLGRDICACAHTGSGKTLAFLIPIFEKLMHSVIKASKFITPRAVVICPTRELAMQIHTVAMQLCQYINNIKVELVVGGISRPEQERVLKSGADFIIATPGRLIDMIHNVANFDLKKIRYLVLDEADKALDQNFIEQIQEIIKQSSPSRQLFLFSATMTENVKELATLSLKNPLKIFLNANTEITEGLSQEFIRIKLDKQEIRESMLISLVCRALSDVKRTIIFMPTKSQCHRMFIMFGLLGVKCAELHGNMTQAQRLNALGKFTLPEADEKRADVLVCTDLASRGIDVTDIQYVINYSMPASLDQYIHRVGRTARCGKNGCAISFVHEKDRHILKKIKTHNRDVELKMRKINLSVLQFYQEKIKQLNKDIEEITLKEKTAEEERLAELDLQRAEDKLKNDTEKSQQRFNWFSEMKRKRSGKNQTGDNKDKESEPKSKKMKKEDPNKGKPFSRKMKKEQEKKHSKKSKRYRK